jgi:hypothetical protein
VLRLIIALLLAVSAVGQGVDRWEFVRQDFPLFNGYLKIRNGGGRTWLYVSAWATIYSTGLWTFDAVNKSLTLIGHNPLGSHCDPGTSTWPADRHPIGQMWYDSNRDRFHIWAGPACNHIQFNHWSIGLGETEWRQEISSFYPWYRDGTTAEPWYNMEYAACAFDPELNAAFCYGFDGSSAARSNHIYCLTDLNPTPGVLTPEQEAAGCSADNWARIHTPTVVPPDLQWGLYGPPGKIYMEMVYIGNHKMMTFGGQYPYNGNSYNEVWMYELLEKKWTRVHDGTGNAPPPLKIQDSGGWVHPVGSPAWAYNSNNGMLYLQHSGDTVTMPQQLWMFNPNTYTWTKLDEGRGPRANTMVYDPTADALVAWTRTFDDYDSEIWVGYFGAETPSGAPTSFRGKARGVKIR